MCVFNFNVIIMVVGNRVYGISFVFVINFFFSDSFLFVIISKIMCIG